MLHVHLHHLAIDSLLSFTQIVLFVLSYLLSISSLSYALVFAHLFFFKQKTAYEMRISDWSSDVCSSDLDPYLGAGSELDFDLLVRNLDDLPDEAAGRHHRIALLDRRDHLAVRLHAALLGPDQQEIEDWNDEQKRHDGVEKRRAAALSAAGSLGVGWRDEHQCAFEIVEPGFGARLYKCKSDTQWKRLRH